jgi:hypothetical protein
MGKIKHCMLYQCFILVLKQISVIYIKKRVTGAIYLTFFSEKQCILS